jgi:hypothetical protein
MKTWMTLTCLISISAFAQLGSGTNTNSNTNPGGAGTVLTPTDTVYQPAGGSGTGATVSRDITPAVPNNNPAGLRTGTGTDLTPTQGQQSGFGTGFGTDPSGTVSSPLPGGNRQAEEVDYSTLPSSSGPTPTNSGSGSGTGSGTGTGPSFMNSTDPTNTAE